MLKLNTQTSVHRNNPEDESNFLLRLDRQGEPKTCDVIVKGEEL